MTEAQAWSRAVEATVPGAKGWVEVRGWMDPTPVWRIDLKDGMSFSGTDKAAVAREFDTYWQSVLRLTGEPP